MPDVLNKPPLQAYSDPLDGMRALSILLVIINHFTIPLHPAFEFFRARGHLGVEIFFAVSGFLVTRSLHICYQKNRGSVKAQLWEFYVRRGTRIFFPYYLTLVVVFLMSFAVGSLREKLLSISDILPSFVFYFFNYAKAYTSGEVPGLLTVMWSLCFEEQFYLLLGIVFVVARKHLAGAFLLLCLASIAIRLYIGATVDEMPFYRIQQETHLRLDAILFGCLAYLYYDKIEGLFRSYNWLYWLTYLSTMAAFYYVGVAKTPFEHGLAFLFTSITFTAFVVAVRTLESGLLYRILSLAPLVLIGKISYEIYLTHQFVIGALVKANLNQNPIVYSALAVGVSVGVSYGYFRFLNAPVQKVTRVWLIGR